MKSSQINSIRNEGLLQTTKPLSFKPHNFQWNVGLIYIMFNKLKMLPSDYEKRKIFKLKKH